MLVGPSMPHRKLVHQHLRFSVMSTALAFVVACAFIILALKPLIPLPEPNELAQSSSPYLRMASHQRIKWRQLDADLFTEARRLDKPILVVVGAAWSRSARLADEFLFNDLELRVFLNRDYLCARVDIDERPDWANGLHPLSRAISRWQWEFHAWVLEPDGTLFATVRRKFPEQTFDPNSVRGQLQTVRRDLERKRRGDLDVASELEQTTNDVRRLFLDSQVVPSASEVREALLKAAGMYGGFPIRISQRPVPAYQPLSVQAWRFMLLTNDQDALRVSLDPALRSPIVDWIDGGFRRQATRNDWKRVELDKLAVVNAEMAALLARTGNLLDDPYHRLLAVSACETLFKRFMHNGLVPSARIGFEGYRGRGPRSSFGPARLNEVLGDLQDVGLRKLNLDHTLNPQMLPYVSDPQVLSEPNVQRVLHLLRESAAVVAPEYKGDGYLDVNALVAARLIEAGRQLGFAEAIEAGSEILDTLNKRVADAEVLPHNVLIQGDEGFLSDYLAYSDACLQRFLATGDFADLARGHRRLDEAIQRFRGFHPFALAVCTPQMQIGPTTTAVPEVVDNFRESTSAMAIRLTNAYGALTRDRADFSMLDGDQLTRWAGSSVAHFGSVVLVESPMTMGIHAAAQEVSQNIVVFTVGRNAVAEANRIAPKFPSAMVAPVSGIRADLAARESGVYVTIRNELRGPLTLNEAQMLTRPIRP